MKNKYSIVDICKYDYNKYGGKITLKFDNGVTSNRYFNNVKADFERYCALSNRVIAAGETCLRVTIKRQHYGTYYIKNEVVQEALRGEFKKVDEEDSLVKELRKFLNVCYAEKMKTEQHDKHLREALREIKFKKSVIGVKMAKGNQLLEVLSK